MKKFFLFLLFLFLSKDFIASNNLKQTLRNCYDKYNPFTDKENNISGISNNKFLLLSYIFCGMGMLISKASFR